MGTISDPGTGIAPAEAAAREERLIHLFAMRDLSFNALANCNSLFFFEECRQYDLLTHQD